MSAKRVNAVELYASAARTATPAASAAHRLAGMRGLLIQIDVTAIVTTPSVVFTVQDALDTDWATLLASAAIVAVGTTFLVCHPDAADRANVSESTQKRSKVRVIAVHGDADSITYSVKLWPIP